MKTFLGVAALALITATPAAACDLCAVYAAYEAQGGASKGFLAGVAEQFTYFNTLQINGRNVPNVGNQYLSSSFSQVFAGYNFNNRFGLQFNLPVIYKEYGYLDRRGHDLGIGDASLLGNVRLYSRLKMKSTLNWSAVVGPKFPTGSARHLNPAEPDFAPGIGGHDLTLGSGSWDGLLGTAVFGRWKKVFLAADAQYAVRSEGAFGYQFANDWTWSGGPGFYVLLHDRYTLALQAVVSGETKGQDTQRGEPLDDTAITSVFLGPQVNFTWGNRLSVEVGADLPVSINAGGEQIVPDYRLRAALTWRF